MDVILISILQKIYRQENIEELKQYQVLIIKTMLIFGHLDA